MVGESIEKIGDCVILLVNKLDGFLGSAKFAKALPYGLGSAIDFGATVVGSMTFDYLYDKYGDKVVEFAGDVWDGTKKVVGDTVKSVGDTAEKIWNSAGDAVNGFFSGLGSVFN